METFPKISDVQVFARYADMLVERWRGKVPFNHDTAARR